MALELPSEQEFVISFQAVGKIKQRVRIVDPAFNAEVLEKLLQSGKALTTIQENGDVVAQINDKLYVIGVVEQVDNQAEFSDFRVEPD
jgi:hypothetical protein